MYWYIDTNISEEHAASFFKVAEGDLRQLRRWRWEALSEVHT
jgi:hypothetical protein